MIIKDELKTNINYFKLKSNTVYVAMVALVALLFGGQAQAVMINMQLTGTVTNADSPNIFDLSVGDTILASATYNDSSLTGSGLESIVFGPGTDNYLTLQVGSILLVQNNDVDYGFGAPGLIFEDGNLSGLNFVSTDPYFFGAGDFLYLGWRAGTNPSSPEVTGVWNEPAFHVVPEPGTLAQFGFVLMIWSLFSIKKRRQIFNQKIFWPSVVSQV